MERIFNSEGETLQSALDALQYKVNESPMDRSSINDITFKHFQVIPGMRQKTGTMLSPSHQQIVPWYEIVAVVCFE